MKTIKEMQAEVTNYCKDKGWGTLTFGECMALIHSEVSEALEAWRDWGTKDATPPWYDEGQPDASPMPKPEGVGSEFADVLIRLLDDCERFGIDLEAEFDRKMAYNRTRPFRHGGKPI